MFGLIKQVFIGLLCFSKSLASAVNTSDHIKCISLNNQQCMDQPTVIILDRCMGSCNTMIYPIKYVFQTKQKI